MKGARLFSPLTIRDLTLKNRIVVAPMHQYSGVKEFPTDWHVMNAGRFAAGGAGLFFVESTKIERRGCGTVGDLGLWDDALIAPLERIVDMVHSQWRGSRDPAWPFRPQGARGIASSNERMK